MSWISGAAAWLLRILIPIVIEIWKKKVDAENARLREIEELKREAAELRKKLEAAETESEREQATDDIARGSF